MIDHEALDMMLERIEARGRDDTRLAHGAAEDFSCPLRARNEIPTAQQHSSSRRAEPLRQAARHRIEAGAKLLCRGAQLRGGIEDARAIEMRGEATALGELERFFQV